MGRSWEALLVPQPGSLQSQTLADPSPLPTSSLGQKQLLHPTSLVALVAAKEMPTTAAPALTDSNVPWGSSFPTFSSSSTSSCSSSSAWPWMAGGTPSSNRSSPGRLTSFWDHGGNTPDHYTVPPANEAANQEKAKLRKQDMSQPVGNNGTVTKEPPTNCPNGLDPLQQGFEGPIITGSNRPHRAEPASKVAVSSNDHSHDGAQPVVGETPVDPALLQQLGHSETASQGGHLLDTPDEYHQFIEHGGAQVLSEHDFQVLEGAAHEGHGNHAAMLDINLGSGTALPEPQQGSMLFPLPAIALAAALGSRRPANAVLPLSSQSATTARTTRTTRTTRTLTQPVTVKVNEPSRSSTPAAKSLNSFL